MKNIRLHLQYDGTKYLGWTGAKKTDSPRFVATKLGNILGKLAGSPLTLYCAHKTEKGVHALSQCVSFTFPGSPSSQKLADYINAYLPSDITLLDVSEVAPSFRADLYIKEKRFEYRICTDPSLFPFVKGYQYLLPAPLSLDKFYKVTAMLKGKHDFSAFSMSSKKKSNEKTVFDCSVKQTGQGIAVSFSANDLLPGMALAIPGAILSYIEGDLSLADIEAAFHKDEGKKIPFAPAFALYLKEISYRHG